MKCDSRLGDVSGGESALGEKAVGEFSLSSLKLKLFLLSDSAPVGRRQNPPAGFLDRGQRSPSGSVSVEHPQVEVTVFSSCRLLPPLIL